MRRLLVVAITLVVGVACAQRSAMDDFRHGGFIECAYESTIATWLDHNGDGQRSDDEPPLSNVSLVVTNATTQHRYQVSSDSSGSATFFLMFAGCKQNYVLDPVTPEGFALSARSEQVINYVHQVSLGFLRRGA